jgi:hypothetical protein
MFTHLDVNRELLHTLKNSVTITTLLSNVFEMQDEQILELMKRNNGIVIQYLDRLTTNSIVDHSSDENQAETCKTNLLWTKSIGMTLLFCYLVQYLMNTYKNAPVSSYTHQ